MVISDISEDVYGYINKKLSINSLIKENASLYIDDILNLSIEILDYIKENGLESKKIRLTPKQTVSLVREILYDIDSILENLFNDSVEKGIILIYPKIKEKKLRKKFLKDKKYFEALCIETEGYHVFCGHSKDDLFVKCPLAGDVSDVIAIVHEVIHLYSRKNAFDKGHLHFTHKKSMFSETPSIYFEKYVADYLVSLGFDKKSVYSSYMDRVVNDILASAFYLAELDFFNVYNRDGCICEGNLLSDERILDIVQNLIQINHFYPNIDSNTTKFLSVINEILEKKDTISWCNGWSSLTAPLKAFPFFNYILGHSYAHKLPQDKNTISGVLDVSKAVNLPVSVVGDRDLSSRLNGLGKLSEKTKIKR